MPDLCSRRVSQLLDRVISKVSEGDGEYLHGAQTHSVSRPHHRAPAQSLEHNLRIVNLTTDHYFVVMEQHLELFKKEPVFCLSLLQVVVKVPGCEPERVELLLRGEEEHGGRLLVVDARVVALPLPHDVDVLLVRCEAVRVPAVSCA